MRCSGFDRSHERWLARARWSTMIRIGTAGWSIHARYGDHFPPGGSHLERYARVLDAVEINSSFYRPHKRGTYERWAAAVPQGFRFAVKLPKAVTHQARLVGAEALLDAFLDEISGLGGKLGPLLVQLPPSLRFDAVITRDFMAAVRERHAGPIACEPRHPSWFDADADDLLAAFRVARVATDLPAGSPAAGEPGGWRGMTYRRLHGSPRVYYSNYDAPQIEAVAERMKNDAAAGVETWCIFDNTAAFEALGNAMDARVRAAR